MADVLLGDLPLDRRRRRSAASTRAGRRRTWAGSPDSASGRPCTTARISPTSSRDLGYVRDDGKTLIGQPHLDLRPEEDVDARRRPRQHVQQPQRAAQSRCPTPNGRPTSPRTAPDGPCRLAKPTTRWVAPRPFRCHPPVTTCRSPTAAPRGARRGRFTPHQLRARRHRDGGRRGREHPRRRLPAGHPPDARLPRGPVLGLQVLPPRRRHPDGATTRRSRATTPRSTRASCCCAGHMRSATAPSSCSTSTRTNSSAACRSRTCAPGSPRSSR